RRFVRTRHLGADDGVPRQAGMLRHTHGEADIRVRARADDVAALEPRQALHDVRPRLETMPDRNEVLDILLGEALDVVLIEQLLEALAMEHVQDRVGAPARADLLHGRLVKTTPVVSELLPVAVQGTRITERRQLTNTAPAPVDDGAEYVEYQRLHLILCSHPLHTPFACRRLLGRGALQPIRDAMPAGVPSVPLRTHAAGCSRATADCQSSAIIAAAFSAIISVGEFVLPDVMVGMTEASAIRSPSRPCAL